MDIQLYWVLILDLVLRWERHCQLLQDVHLNLEKADSLIDLLLASLRGNLLLEIDAAQVEWLYQAHEGQDVQLPLALDDLLQDGRPMTLEEDLAEQLLPAPIIDSLDLIV